MEHELDGANSVPPSSKQTFIYKKNPANTAKAITRKMRPSHAPAPLEPQNSAGGPDSAYRTAGGKSRFDGARSSQNEAETIATQGQRSGVSPSSKALSQGHFGGNVDSSGALGSFGARGTQKDNRRFQRGMGGSTGKKGSYYEDNIESETEVFFDPQFEGSKTGQPARRTEMNQKRKQAARELFPSSDDQANNYLQKKPHRKNQPQQQQQKPLSQADHFKAIDTVMNSNADDRTKQRLIADIQDKYRQSQQQQQQRAPEAGKAAKPKNQKMYTKEDQLMPGEVGQAAPQLSSQMGQQPGRKLRGPPLTSSGFGSEAPGDHLPQKGRTAKAQRQARARRQPDDQRDHQNFLMPEMNDFIDAEAIVKHNYLTQDEMGGGARLKKDGVNKPKKNKQWAESDDNGDDLVNGKIQHFTPGRIRASRMGLKQNAPGEEMMNSTGEIGGVGAAQKNRARTKQPNNAGPSVESVDRDDSMQSVENAADYKQILPAVKVRQKKKNKNNRSPSEHSPGENSSINAGAGMRGARNHSTSRISGYNHAKDPKLRATLDQNLHWKPTSVKVPIKQTNFYDDKHQSGITDQQIQTWKINKQGNVLLDEFNTGKKKIPVNRHRIPRIGDEKVIVGSGAPRKGGPGRPGQSPDSFLWDMDGRRHKKPKQPKPDRGITQNASHRKVDLPKIQSSQPNLLSPNGTNSQPAGMGRLPGPPGKFIGPNDKRLLKNIIPPPTHETSGPLDVIDIDIKPANPNPPNRNQQPPTDSDLPDYDCPVCLIRVKGRDTAPHSRNCRTQACRFCKIEQPLAELDQHERTCNKDQSPIRCRFCRCEFPADQIIDHETYRCKEPGRCRFCKIVFPVRELPPHEEHCNNLQACKGCKNGFPPQDINRHESVCPWPARCRFCQQQFPIREIDRHEGQCQAPSKCRGCNKEFPRRTFFDVHVDECPDLVPCDFCGSEYPPKDINMHEANCNGPMTCTICQNKFPRLEIPQHESNCDGGLKPEVDPRPYLNHVEKQRQKLQKKSRGSVFVEDDYVKPEEFRDPGGRKKRDNVNSKSNTDSGQPSPFRSRGSERPPASRSLGRKSSKSKSPHQTFDRNSQERSHKSLGKDADSIEHTVTPTITAQVNPHSPFNNRNGRLNVNPRSNTDGGIPGDSLEDRTPKGILKDGNNKDASTPNRQSSREGGGASRNHGSKIASGVATGSMPMTRGLTSGGGELNSRHPPNHKMIGDSHSRSTAFKSEDRLKGGLNTASNARNGNTEGDISVGSRGEHLPPQTEKPGHIDGLNDSMEKGSGPRRHNDRYDYRTNNSQEAGVGGRGGDGGGAGAGDKDDGDSRPNMAGDTADHDPRVGKHLYSSNDVTSSKRNAAQEKKESSEYVSGDVKLNKIKSQTATSQVRFAYGTTDSLVQDNKQQMAQEKQGKVTSSQVMQSGKFRQSSIEATSQQQTVSMRKQKSELDEDHEKSLAQKKKKSSPDGTKRGRSVTKSQTGDMKSHTSSAGRQKFGKMYFPDDSKSGGRSNNSKSPEARRVMGMLTHHRVKIDKETKLLINGSEILTQEGIKGNINKVGVGFGTGRWTSGRRMDLLKEVPIALQKKRAQDRADSIETPNHRRPVRRDAETQHQEPDVHSEGCDPISPSLRSEKVSAHVSGRDLGLSARTQTVQPDRESVGVSAKPISEISVREQGDQITEGRFEPVMVDTQVNTDRKLLDDYLSIPKQDFGINTTPVIFGQAKPKTYSALIQTEPMVNEHGPMDEPIAASLAHEPETAKVNPETGSQSSLIDVPECDGVLKLLLPEPAEDEDPYVDDWYESRIYRYAYELHYEHMVKKRLISETVVKRPVPPPEQAGMTRAQKYEHNLNPDGLSILSYMECDYGQSALRHKSATYLNESMLEDLYTRAKTTISVLNANMVRPDICDRVLFNHYSEVTRKNVIKLLIRVKRLYDARNESVNILKLVMEVEAVIQPKSDLWRILGDNGRQPLKKAFHELLERTLHILSNALMHITIFQQEHHLFKDEFKFNKKEYRDYIRDIGRIIGGFLKLKGKPNPALQETGLLLEEHEEHRQQSERYQEWVAQSLQDYGRLEMPNEEEIGQTLQTQKPDKKLKGSRIDRALNKLREEQKVKEERESSAMELTSKSKILQQMQIKQVQLEVQKQQASYQANTEWQKTSISDQMIDRLQESANKRERIAREQEEQRKRQERRDRGEDSESREDEPLKLDDLRMHHQRSDMDIEYEQINIGRFNFAPSDLSQRHPPSISIRDQQKSQGKNYVAFPQLNGSMRNQSSLQHQSASAMNTDRKTETNPTHHQVQNTDYLDGQKSNQGLMQINSTSSPSVQTMVPGATSGNLPLTFGRPVAAREGSAMQFNRNSRMSDDMEGQTEFTEQMDADSEHIIHEIGSSIEKVQAESQNNDDDEDGHTVNSARGKEEGQGDYDQKSNLKIINQGQIKIKYQASSAAASQENPLSKADSFNDRQ